MLRLCSLSIPVRFALLASFLLFEGCTTTKAIGPEPDEPRAAPTTPPVAPSPDDPVGRPCGPDDTKTCGTKGRVAVGVMQTTNMAKRMKPPCTLPERDPKAPFDPGGHTTGCIEGERVYVVGSCMECRIFSEWMMVAVVSEMTDAQLEEAQQRARLPRSPLLKTTASWKGALSARR
ncbi:MAG: hypothetical protein JST00_18915 [Deltaproteobacteria bacterium]|nr:hypothetical protein [Deltaproteobacteria bacterium]